MKIFKVNKNINIVCEWKKTRNGFKHTATLLYNGNEMESVKCCYLNRTWERYKYESVLKKLANETEQLTDEEKKLFKDVIKNNGVNDEMAQLKNIGMVAMLGDILAETQKDRNDWKKRMLKAGLGEGMILPDDFDTLPEKEKERRLNGAIKIMTKQEV